MQSVIQFVVSHPALFATTGALLIDYIWAINPKTETNGALHWVHDKLIGIKDQPKPPVA